MTHRLTIFGDSHAGPFKVTPQVMQVVPALKDFDIETNVISGSTITGMGRRLSTLRTQETILESLEVRTPDYVIFSFGQVDVELGYFYRQIVKDERTEFGDFADDIVQTYIQSVQDIVGQKTKAVVKGINPPVLIHDHKKAVHYTSRIITENIDDRTEVRHLTRRLHDCYPGDFERTQRHLMFNRILRSRARQNGIPYFDLMDLLVDRTTGLVDLRYMPAFQDHHISDSLWMRQQYWQHFFDLGLLGNKPGFLGKISQRLGTLLRP